MVLREWEPEREQGDLYFKLAMAGRITTLNEQDWAWVGARLLIDKIVIILSQMDKAQDLFIGKYRTEKNLKV